MMAKKRETAVEFRVWSLGFRVGMEEWKRKRKLLDYLGFSVYGFRVSVSRLMMGITGFTSRLLNRYYSSVDDSQSSWRVRLPYWLLVGHFMQAIFKTQPLPNGASPISHSVPLREYFKYASSGSRVVILVPFQNARAVWRDVGGLQTFSLGF